MRVVEAKMPGGGYSREDALETVCCLDPWMVLSHFHDEFGDALAIDGTDLSQKDYEYFRAEGDTSGALRIAERDAGRRGPAYMFTIKIGEGEARGHV